MSRGKRLGTLKPISPPRNRSNFESLEKRRMLSAAATSVVIGQTHYFVSTDAATLNDLIATNLDGSDQRILLAATAANRAAPHDLINYDEQLYFINNTTVYRSDGTAAGTKQIVLGNNAELITSAAPQIFGVAGDRLLYSAESPYNPNSYNTWHTVLWSYDGATHSVTQLTPADATETDNFSIADGVGHFTTRDANDIFTNWFTDGTAAGTLPANNFLSVSGTSGPDNIVVVKANDHSYRVTVNNFSSYYAFASYLDGIVINAGDGSDHVTVDSSIDLPVTIYGGSGSDTLIGGSANDIIVGGDGDDSIDGGYGNDTLIGGAGANTLDDSLHTAGLTQAIMSDGTVGHMVLSTGTYDTDRIESFNGLIGTDYADMLTLANYAYVDARGGDDVITDLCSYIPQAIMHGGEGNDRLTLTNDTNPDFNHSSAVETNQIDGNDRYGPNTLYGDAGNDTLTGNGDVFGGAGIDTADLSSFGIARPYEYSSNWWRDEGYTPAIGVQVSLDDNANDGTFGHGNIHSDIEAVIGTPYADGLAGSDSGVTLIGNGGNDLLRGGAGDDSLVAGLGKVTLYGSTAHDTIVADGDDKIVDFEYTPSTTDTSGTTGGGTTSTTSSGGGSTTPTFIAPTATLNSGGLLVIDVGNNSVGVFVSLHANGLINVQFDESEAGIHFDASKVEALLITDESPRGDSIANASHRPATIFGSAGPDAISTSGSSNVIHGGGGNDEIQAVDGTNFFYGDAGNDTLLGGSGVDRLYGGDGNDYIDGGSGNDILYGEAGNDHLFGQAGTDHLNGGAGTNLLRGGDGHDLISYLTGDDIHANAGDMLTINSIVG